jgi:hypothetical protein
MPSHVGELRQRDAEIGKSRPGDFERIYAQSMLGPLAKPNFHRAWRGEASPRTAIKAMCIHCMGGSRAVVAACSSEVCPRVGLQTVSDGLMRPLRCRYRPYQG